MNSRHFAKNWPGLFFTGNLPQMEDNDAEIKVRGARLFLVYSDG